MGTDKHGKKSTELSMSTSKTIKKICAPIPTSSISLVNTVKKKKRSPEQKEQKLKRIKEKALAEQEEAQVIISKMEENAKSGRDEDDHLAVYGDMYKQLRRIIRKTERGCLKSKNGQGAYQLATLYSQLRETIHDIRSMQDLSDQTEMLIEKVVQPLFTTLVQQLSNSMYEVKLKTKDKLHEKRVRRCFEDIDEITVSAARAMQELYEKTCGEIKKILIGEE